MDLFGLGPDGSHKLIAVIIYFIAMLLIGFYAFKKTDDGDDYMLGGRRLHPFTAALSAGASDMSGWLMMGLPGALYMMGMFQAWMAIGLTIGAALNWIFVAPRLRRFTEVTNDSITIPSYFENRLGDKSRILRIVSGIVILVFFTFYVSSGMTAGGKFFQSSFNGSYLTGMLLVAGITLAYTMFGGFLGATYTDTVQGLIMLAALLIVPVLAVISVGGPQQVIDGVLSVNPDFGSLMKGGTIVGAVSAAAWGLGYFGQPHIIIRFMALRSSRDAGWGAVIGVGWMVLSVLGVIVTSMAGIAYFNLNQDKQLTDAKSAETVVLDLAQNLMPPLLAGFVLAAVLAAIMSTISSQLVVTSSALVEDLALVFKPGMSKVMKLWLGRIAVLIVAIIAGFLALEENATVLGLVAFAWAGFGSAFGPVVVLSLYWKRLTNWGAMAGILGGAVVAFVWSKSQTLSTLGGALSEPLYEIVPGFLTCLVLAVVVSLITPAPGEKELAGFHHMETQTQAVPIVQVADAGATAGSANPGQPGTGMKA